MLEKRINTINEIQAYSDNIGDIRNPSTFPLIISLSLTWTMMMISVTVPQTDAYTYIDQEASIIGIGSPAMICWLRSHFCQRKQRHIENEWNGMQCIAFASTCTYFMLPKPE
jgi:hypothetical protein